MQRVIKNIDNMCELLYYFCQLNREQIKHCKRIFRKCWIKIKLGVRISYTLQGMLEKFA